MVPAAGTRKQPELRLDRLIIVATGIDALNPLEPQVGMDIGLIKQRYGDLVAPIGNIDCGHLIAQAPAEQLREVTRLTVDH